MEMKPITILLVEDNPDHVLIIKRGLEANNIINDVRVTQDGQLALDYLFRRGAYADPQTSPRPGLILLDIKLPRVDGFEVLQRIKRDASLKSIPVVVLTSSEQDIDISKSYTEGANSYITKPIQFMEFVEKIRKMELYWALVNRLPSETIPRTSALEVA